MSQINIEFPPGTDIDDVLQKVKDKVDEAKNDLPTDLEDDPAVFEVNISELPIVVFSLSGSCGITCLKDIADDLADEIEAIPGVLEVDVTVAGSAKSASRSNRTNWPTTAFRSPRFSRWSTVKT